MASDLEHWNIVAEVLKDRVEEIHIVSDPSRNIRRQQQKHVWHLGQFLGRGASGEVRLQHNHEEGKVRAVKRILTESHDLNKFDCQKEMEALLEFSKPKFKEAACFIEFYGWFTDGPEFYLAMEYLQLGDLEKNMPSSGKIPELEARDIAAQILLGLKIMHGANFAHRDLKPQNVLVVNRPPEGAQGGQWWIKLADFGLSKRMTEITAHHSRSGTRAYMAPEMLVSNNHSSGADYTNAVDIWATGCIVYRLVTGRVPFVDDDLNAYCKNHFFPLDQLYDERIKSRGIRFLQELLVPLAKERPSASQALQHDWIDTVPNPRSVPIVGSKASEQVAASISKLNVTDNNYATATHEGLRSIAQATPTLEARQSDYHPPSSPGHVTLFQTSTRPQPQKLLSGPLPQHTPFQSQQSPPSASLPQQSLPLITPFDSQQSPPSSKLTRAQLQQLLSTRGPPNLLFQPQHLPPSASARAQPQQSLSDPFLANAPIQSQQLPLNTSTWAQSQQSPYSPSPRPQSQQFPQNPSYDSQSLEGRHPDITFRGPTPKYQLSQDPIEWWTHGSETTSDQTTAKPDGSRKWEGGTGSREVTGQEATNGSFNVTSPSQQEEQPKVSQKKIDHYLWQAAHEGKIDSVRQSLDEGANVNARDTNLTTALHFASGQGHLAVVRLLIFEGAIIDARTKNFWTPLHHASARGHLVVVQLLILEGAEIGSRGEKSSTPLHYASAQGYRAVVRLLIVEGAEIDSRDEESWTPLRLASDRGHLAVVQILITKRAKIDMRGEESWTPLHDASAQGHLAVVRLLIKEGAIIDARAKDSWTPLHLACDYGHLSVVKLLLHEGADIEATFSDGHTPLFIATKYNHQDVINILLKRGANPNTARCKDNRRNGEEVFGGGVFGERMFDEGRELMDELEEWI